MIISVIHKKNSLARVENEKAIKCDDFPKRYRAARLDKDMKGNIIFYV